MNTLKSFEDYILGLYGAIFVDIAEYDPSLRLDCERDYKRLLSIVEHRGIPFVCDTMVQFAKHFDRCLADQRLTPSNLPGYGVFRKGGVIPRLFKGLLLRVFDENGDLKSEPDVQAIRWLRQLNMLGKSMKIACPTQRIYENVQEFVKTDGEVRSADLDWSDANFRPCDARNLQFGDYDVHDLPDFAYSDGVTESRLPSIIGRCDFSTTQRVADIVSATLGGFNPSEWRFRHGPGAVSDLKGQILPKYRFPSWSDRLERVFPYADFAFANYSLWAEQLDNEDGFFPGLEWHRDEGSRMIAVPKTYRAPRLIAAEPVALQWCQQSIRDFLMTRVQETFISRSVRFADQGYNGSYALEASRHGDAATIDLSSASDRISCWMVERLFRRNPTLLDALQASRSQFISQDLDRKCAQVIPLRKFSTMGSAVTFPIQSLLFLVIAWSAVLETRKLSPNIRNIKKIARTVRVFGDDIIVPKDAWIRTMALLEAFGLKVNTSKTFGTGLFRESCGVDAYHGHIVTKVNVNHVPLWSKPESILSSVDCHNNLFLQGLWNAARFVRKAVERGRGRTFPFVGLDSGITGWLTFMPSTNTGLKSRWNKWLSRREFLVPQPSADNIRVQYDDGCSLTQYFTECTNSIICEGDRIGIPVNKRALKLRRTWVSLT